MVRWLRGDFGSTNLNVDRSVRHRFRFASSSCAISRRSMLRFGAASNCVRRARRSAAKGRRAARFLVR
jgi:hypothetical protein